MVQEGFADQWNNWRKFNILADNDEIDLTDANLSGAFLDYFNLSDAQLFFADLSNASMCDANLCGADLSNANLQGAKLTGTNLTGANLSGADLRGADLRDANLTNTNMDGALTGELESEIDPDMVTDDNGADADITDVAP